MKIKNFLPVLFLFLSMQIFALDINEKLTLRVLKLSVSKKTVLINRGVEDGLAVGDHAKFYLTSGMVARGVVAKVSPSRSVWSLYRLIEPDQLLENKVINLKIATPVKITIDESKMIAVEPIARVGKDIPLVRDTGVTGYNPNEIPLSTRSVVRDADIDASQELEELEALKSGNSQTSVRRTTKGELTTSDIEIIEPTYNGRSPKTWELFGLGQYSSLSTTVQNDVGTVDSSGTSGGYDLHFGVEKFFPKNGAWFDKLSIGGFLHFGDAEAISVSGTQGKNSIFGYGLFGRYYFYNHAQDIGRLIGFGGLGFGAGSVEDSDATSSSGTYSGSASSFSLGGGIKYFWSNWGFTAQSDYYARSESYTVTDAAGANTETSKSLAGLRILLGLVWKFNL